MDDKDKLIDAMAGYTKDVDRLNKRILVCATIVIAIVTIASWIAISFISYTYFTADYYYPTIETTDSENTTNTIGGE